MNGAMLMRNALKQSSRSYGSTATRNAQMASRRLIYVGAFGGAAIAALAVRTLWQQQEWSLVPIAHCEARVVAPPAGVSERVEPASSINFPSKLRTLSLPDSLVLLGLGVRTVSFLRVKVYAAGFYIEDKVLNAPVLASPKTKTSGSPEESASVIETLISGPAACCVRIVPTRSTDFGHLRDGFARALTARQKAASKAGTLTEADEVRISQSVQTFKGFFPSAAVPKGNELLLVKSPSGQLIVEYDGKVLGELDDAWIAREMMMAYFASQNVISAPLKADVAAGLERIANGEPL